MNLSLQAFAAAGYFGKVCDGALLPVAKSEGMSRVAQRQMRIETERSAKSTWLSAHRGFSVRQITASAPQANNHREGYSMAKLRLVCVLFGCSAAWYSTNFCRANQAEDEAAIRQSDKAYVEAYNKRDAKALAALWSPEAVYIDPETGSEFVGRDEIEEEFAETFAGLKDAKLEVNVDSIKFLSPNVAVENGTARVIYPEQEPDESSYAALFVKRDGKWLLDRVTEEEAAPPPAPQPSNYEHLKELEWMIGSWVDQDKDVTIQTNCDWTKNQNFINRSFAVIAGGEVDMAGMQIIGWDPAAKQIRSWTFDSEGGYAEGKWTHSGDRWLVHQTGILSDGRPSSSVNIFTPVDDNSFKWQSIQRAIGGDVLPNVDEVLVVRKLAE